MHRNPNRLCVYCAKPFYAKPKDIAKGGGNYCSMVHYRIDSGHKIYPYTSNCPVCNKDIEHKTTRDRRRFCSQSCAATTSNMNRVGTKYKTDNANSQFLFKKKLFATYKRECMVCGYSAFVEAHHIVPRSRGGTNEIGNGILLCPNHHREADHKTLTQEQLFSILERCQSPAMVQS